MRVGDHGGCQRRIREAGGGEKAGCALRVVDDRDFEERVCRVLAAEQLLGEEGDEGDVVDDGLGDSSPSVADDGSLAELEPEDDRGSTRWSRQVTTSSCAAGMPSAAGV